MFHFSAQNQSHHRPGSVLRGATRGLAGHGSWMIIGYWRIISSLDDHRVDEYGAYWMIMVSSCKCLFNDGSWWLMFADGVWYIGKLHISDTWYWLTMVQSGKQWRLTSVMWSALGGIDIAWWWYITAKNNSERDNDDVIVISGGEWEVAN